MRFLSIVSTLAIAANAAAYTGGGGYSGNALMGASSNGGGAQQSQQYGGGDGRKGPITAAVESQRTVEIRPIQSMPREPLEPQIIEVPSEDMPVTVHFKSQSSRVLIQQTHTPAASSEPEHTSSEDEPQRVIHEVVKPVIQEVREIIQPYRRLIQQIQPVIEQTHTVIAKGEPRPSVAPLGINDINSGAGGSGSSGNSGHGGQQGGQGQSFGGSGFSGQMRTNDYAAAASAPAPASSVSVSSPGMQVKSVPESVIRIHKPSAVVQDNAAPHRSQQQQQQQHRHHSSASKAAQSAERDQPSKFPMAIQQLFTQHLPHDQHQPEPKPRAQYQQQQYSKRQGEAVQARPAYTPARMTLRAAPAVNYQPAQQQYQRRSARYIAPQPQAHANFLPYRGYELTPEDLQLLSFVAQPIRYRARA